MPVEHIRVEYPPFLCGESGTDTCYNLESPNYIKEYAIGTLDATQTICSYSISSEKICSPVWGEYGYQGLDCPCDGNSLQPGATCIYSRVPTVQQISCSPSSIPSPSNTASRTASQSPSQTPTQTPTGTASKTSTQTPTPTKPVNNACTPSCMTADEYIRKYQLDCNANGTPYKCQSGMLRYGAEMMGYDLPLQKTDIQVTIIGDICSYTYRARSGSDNDGDTLYWCGFGLGEGDVTCVQSLPITPCQNAPSNSATGSSTPSPTPTQTASKTYTYSASWTPTPTNTQTPTGTPTHSGTGTASWTPTPTNTQTPTGTPTRSGTGTPSWTPTRTPVWSSSPTPSFTPINGCREFYCSAFQAVLTSDSPPLCIYYYEATVSYRRLQYNGCPDGQFYDDFEYLGCVDSCPETLNPNYDTMVCEQKRTGWCGDEYCDPVFEDFVSCPQDCKPYEPICGNRICDSDYGETLDNCPQDCTCGNNSCEIHLGETLENCSSDCGICGNGECDIYESCSSCEQDCGVCADYTYCGDGTCNGNEDCSSCSQDCGMCPPTYSCANPDDLLSGTTCKHVEMALVRPCSSSSSQTPSQTPSRTASKTYTFTASSSGTGTASKTYTYSASWTPTPTNTQTPTRSGTGTSTQTPTGTPTPTPTSVPIILYPNVMSEGSILDKGTFWLPTILGNANIEYCLESLNNNYGTCAPSWLTPSEHKQSVDTLWVACGVSACEAAYPSTYLQECRNAMYNFGTSLEIEDVVNVFKSAQNKACFGYDDLRFSYYPSLVIAGGIKHISFSQCSINIGTCIQNCEIFNMCRDSYKMCLDQTCMATGEYTMECHQQKDLNVYSLDNNGYYIAEAARSEFGCSGNWDGSGGGGGGGGGVTCAGNPCGENIISCCPYQGSETCANPDGTCPEQGNQCGSGTMYCDLGESCCGSVCSVGGVCPDSGGGGTCNGNGICDPWESADDCNDCGCNYNNICEAARGEDEYCPDDCGLCNSNGVCEPLRGEVYGSCEDCSSDTSSGGGEAPSGGTNPCQGGGSWNWQTSSCESSQPSCSSPEGSIWTGAECACESPKMNFGGVCREPVQEDCLSPRGSTWDRDQGRCLCASQMKDDGMGECVPYDSGSGEQYMDPNYYRRLRGIHQTQR